MQTQGIVLRLLVVFMLWSRVASATTCPELVAHRASPSDDAVAWAEPIWRSIAAAAHTPTPRIVWLAPSSLAAGAWYCASSDTIYVARALLDYTFVGRASDGADLLAFALAHELAHRTYDVGDRDFADTCPTTDPVIEGAADRRAAFLMATAQNPDTRRGFSPFALARRDAIARLFTAELGWSADCPTLALRLAAFDGAIDRIGDLAKVWDVTLDLAYADPELAVQVIGTLTTSSGWDAQPELHLLDALAHLDRLQEAGWCPAELRHTGLDPDPCTLPCAVVFPRYPRLAPRDRDGQRGGIDRSREIRAVRQSLVRAREQGVAVADLAGVEACFAYLQADPARAQDVLHALAPTTSASRAALADDAAIFRLQRFLLEESSPILSDDWRDALVALPASADPGPADAAMASWLGRTTPRTLVVPASPPTAACPPQVERIVAGRSTILTQGECASLRLGTRDIELTPLADDGRRDLGWWTSHCALGPPGTADDGSRVWRARCDGSTWILHTRAASLERATRIDVSQ